MIPGFRKTQSCLSPFSRKERPFHRDEYASVFSRCRARAVIGLAAGLLGVSALSAWSQPAAEGPVEQTEAAAVERAAAAEPEVATLQAADGVRLTADFYEAAGKERALALLFHQAGSNAAEYGPIAPRLARLGISSLALDQRSGGNMWGRGNRTVFRQGKSSGFREAYRDLEAALEWAEGRQPRRPVLLWGSSYSAALVFRLASQHQAEVTALLSFSPGEYLGPGQPVRGWAARVRRPIFVASAPGHEVAVARRILDAAPAELKRQFVPRQGVHGSSLLREDRNPGQTGEAWQAVEAFLAEVLP